MMFGDWWAKEISAMYGMDAKEIAFCAWKAACEEAVLQERKAALESVNSLITTGDLGGNGCDMNAQRNGVVLAANTLVERMRSTPC